MFRRVFGGGGTVRGTVRDSVVEVEAAPVQTVDPKVQVATARITGHVMRGIKKPVEFTSTELDKTTAAGVLAYFRDPTLLQTMGGKDYSKIQEITVEGKYYGSVEDYLKASSAAESQVASAGVPAETILAHRNSVLVSTTSELKGYPSYDRSGSINDFEALVKVMFNSYREKCGIDETILAKFTKEDHIAFLLYVETRLTSFKNRSDNSPVQIGHEKAFIARYTDIFEKCNIDDMPFCCGRSATAIDPTRVTYKDQLWGACMDIDDNGTLDAILKDHPEHEAVLRAYAQFSKPGAKTKEAAQELFSASLKSNLEKLSVGNKVPVDQREANLKNLVAFMLTASEYKDLMEFLESEVPYYFDRQLFTKLGHMFPSNDPQEIKKQFLEMLDQFPNKERFISSQKIPSVIDRIKSFADYRENSFDIAVYMGVIHGAFRSYEEARFLIAMHKDEKIDSFDGLERNLTGWKDSERNPIPAINAYIEEKGLAGENLNLFLSYLEREGIINPQELDALEKGTDLNPRVTPPSLNSGEEVAAAPVYESDGGGSEYSWGSSSDEEEPGHATGHETEEVELPVGWESAVVEDESSPDNGKTYYYNTVTNETAWELPKEVLEEDE